MAQPLLDAALPAITPAGADAWLPYAKCRERVPVALEPWLAEPGRLTARVRAACGAATRLRMLRLEPAPMDPHIARRLGVDDVTCLLREIEFTCGARSWIFAQTVLPQSTVQHHPWLRDLGDKVPSAERGESYGSPAVPIPNTGCGNLGSGRSALL